MQPINNKTQELEKKLKESRERYRIISELTSDFAYCFLIGKDKKPVYEWSTDAIILTTGYTVEEILEIGWEKVIHPDDIEIVFNRLDRLLKGESDFSEFRIVTKSGEIRWIKSYGHPVVDEKLKTVTRIYGAAQDITRRKLAIEALQISEERFHALADASFEGILVIDNGVILDTNTQGATMFGYTTKEITGMHIEKILIQWGISDPLAILSSSCRKPCECSALRKDASKITVEIQSRRFPYKGKMVSMSAIRDITNNIKTQKALKDSEERYRRLITASPAYTYAVNISNGRAVSTVHSIGCRMITGYSPEEYKSNPLLWHSMIYPDDTERVEKSINEVMNGNSPAPIEHRIIKKGGSVIWIRNTMVPNFDENYKLLSYDGLIEDISERKKSEAEREMLIKDLQDALSKVKTLSGLLPICASCKKIRDDKGYWQQIELYIKNHSEAEFSHGICPECMKKLYPEYSS